MSPDVILCGWLGLKHQLTNQLTSLPQHQQQFIITEAVQQNNRGLHCNLIKMRAAWIIIAINASKSIQTWKIKVLTEAEISVGHFPVKKNKNQNKKLPSDNHETCKLRLADVFVSYYQWFPQLPSPISWIHHDICDSRIDGHFRSHTLLKEEFCPLMSSAIYYRWQHTLGFLCVFLVGGGGESLFFFLVCIFLY